MAVHLTQNRAGFRHGWTEITAPYEDDIGVGLAVLKLRPGEIHDVSTETETAYLLMSGRIEGTLGQLAFDLVRHSLFDDMPSCLHVAGGERINLSADGEVELAIWTVDNAERFAARIFEPKDVAAQFRGGGLAGEAGLHIVRAMFDGSNSPEEAMLVLGEMLTLPGRWSGWPPQHQLQPGVCHYRFTRPEGYGHAELGETVFKVRPFDTVKIPPAHDHAHTAAPGYGMYSARAIRHLPEARYTVPEVAPEHRWTTEPGAEIWRPHGLTAHD